MHRGETGGILIAGVLAFAALFALLAAAPLRAQQAVWVQIAARNDLAEAQAFVRQHLGRLRPLNGFALPNGWYAVALGPFGPAEAREVLQQLRATRQIPSDSYITDGRRFKARFWPPAEALAPAGAGTAEGAPPRQSRPQAEAAASAGAAGAAAGPSPAASARPLADEPPPLAADETLQEARASERSLDRRQRELLQRALQWEGHYDAAIDGAFGPATRHAMAAWQRAEGVEATGVLTTAQRRKLVSRYEAALASLGLERLRDDRAGIEIELPLALVAFDRHEPPLALWQERNGSGVRVMLISQAGDALALRGLYDILQGLEIMPPEGARSLSPRSFTLSGQDERLASHAFARLAGGEIKGFVLVWPSGDENRRRLALEAMRRSFTPLPGTVLPAPEALADPQEFAHLSGLAIRRPALVRSGVRVSREGAVLTAAAGIENCARITLDDTTAAVLEATDPQSGLALLRPERPQAAPGVAQLSGTPPRPGAEIAVAGFSFGGILGAPTLTFGRLRDPRGPDGEPFLDLLSLKAAGPDIGGPVLDATGSLVGLLLPPPADSRRLLPPAVHPAADSEAILRFLDSRKIGAVRADPGPEMAPEDLAAAAADMTALIGCWR